MALPPDPEGQNANRAEWAEAALVAFEDETGAERNYSIGDLLSDLMHFCDRNPEIVFGNQLLMAVHHYSDETDGEGKQMTAPVGIPAAECNIEKFMAEVLAKAQRGEYRR